MITRLAVLTFFLLSVIPARATGDFNITYTHSYTIDQEGLANAQLNVSLTNNHADRFAKEYKIIFTSNHLQNIIIQNKRGHHIPSVINSQNAHTSITLTFDQPVVGLGKTQQFTLTYIDPDISQVSGNVLELTIPKIEQASGIDTYHVELYIPKEFGEPVLLSPENYTVSSDPAYTKISYTNIPADSGISALFGDHQTYEFTLNYQIQNTSVTPLETQIALPPDTAYQKIYLNNIEPNPISIEPDVDGNWIATFALEPKQQKRVVVNGIVVVYAKPQVLVPSYQSNLSIYLEEKKYWPISSAGIQNIVKTVKTAEDIFKYTVTTLDYDHSRLQNGTTNRLGALNALEAPNSSLCAEYADVFITLARAAGIPARLLTGYAYTQNETLRPVGLIKDVLHAWPEFYDLQEKRWIPVDPTWADTTGGIDYFHHLDFSHIVFAIQGQYSDKPFSAGYYKDESTGQDVIVTYSTIVPTEKIVYKPRLTKPLLSLIGIQNSLNLNLTNLSNIALYNQEISGNIGSPDFNRTQVANLLPFQTRQYSFPQANTSADLSQSTIAIDNTPWTIDYEDAQNAGKTIRTFALAAGMGTAIIVITLVIRRVFIPR